MHKTWFLWLAFAGLSTAVQAQTEKATTLVGLSVGDIAYGRRSAGNFSVSAAILPSVGWFVADNLALLATIGIGYDYVKRGGFGNSYVIQGSELSLSPGVRYYVLGQGQHQLFGQASFDLLRTSFREEYTGQNSSSRSYKTSYQGASAGVGYNYFVTSSVALEAFIGYQRLLNKDVSRPRYPNSLLANVGFTLFLPSNGAAE